MLVVKDLTDNAAYPNSPSGGGLLIVFEGQSGFEDYLNYGERYRGYLCPPADGDYTFWIAADDMAELYISTDINPANKTQIAVIESGSAYQEWTAHLSQQSVAIKLKGGQAYYIEVLHNQGTGGYNLSVAGYRATNHYRAVPLDLRAE